MRMARERLGMPQDRLGVAIGIDEGSASARMSRYETGVHEPQIATARLIAKALKVPLPYLYCDDEVLAELILAVAALPATDKQRLLESLASYHVRPLGKTS
ncbi:helix-turn-helix domain-containing protein [Acidovorax sp. sic0104]|nr:helix-turn-helix transcriptional regulator [Acidovorax sp. sic0104]MBV7539461.1 helix-turn-helix domain-containing protein [Acidovorax sp. sic0104]